MVTMDVMMMRMVMKTLNIVYIFTCMLHWKSERVWRVKQLIFLLYACKLCVEWNTEFFRVTGESYLYIHIYTYYYYFQVMEERGTE